jgi:1-acyl-sn-glycerol-3-phosphate acyltransferase
MAFAVLLHEPTYVLKKELIRIPFFGWFLARAEMIAVDRRAGAAALRQVVAGAERVAAMGRPLVIFPEGTRTPVGSRQPYQPGIAAIYERLGRPVIPVALNSGLFWARRSFVKRSGTITIEFLPPIEPGLPRRAFLAELEKRIETESDRLVAETGGRFERLPGAGRG